jgi:hypothetical protein
VAAVTGEPEGHLGNRSETVVVMVAPVRRQDRVGEQTAVVCHCVYVRPSFAGRSIVGMLMRPPYGDHAAWPVSSYRMTRTFGASFGALASRNASQSVWICEYGVRQTVWSGSRQANHAQLLEKSRPFSYDRSALGRMRTQPVWLSAFAAKPLRRDISP